MNLEFPKKTFLSKGPIRIVIPIFNFSGIFDFNKNIPWRIKDISSVKARMQYIIQKIIPIHLL